MSCSTKRFSTRIAAALAVLSVGAAAVAGDPGDRGRGRGKDNDHKRSSGISITIGNGVIFGGGSGGWNQHRQPRYEPRHEPRVVISRPAPVCVEEVPCEVRFSAFQSQDRVIIVVEGSNKAGGYTTSLTAIEHCEGVPTLVMRNTAPAHCGAACVTPFSLNAAIQSRARLCTLKIRLADRTYDVPVTQVPSLS